MSTRGLIHAPDPPAAVERPVWLRPVLVALAGAGFAWWFWHVRVPASPGNLPDFTIFRAAGTPGPVYDAQWLTGLQGAVHPRPFAYPPTFILICRALALIPQVWAYLLWDGLCAVLFVEATARLVARGGWLVLASPLVLLNLALGQTSLFIGALLTFGVSLLDRPVVAGLLFGAAFAIKPQVMLLLPVALAFGGYWRALVFLGLGGLLLCAASLLLGPQLWFDWLSSLSQFQAINREIGVWRLSAPMPYTPLALIGALICLWFGMKGDNATRLVCIIGGSLLILPHAQSYETAMLVPPALAMLFARQWRSLAAVPMLVVRFLQPWGLAAYVLAACFGAHRLPSRLSGAAAAPGGPAQAGGR